MGSKIIGVVFLLGAAACGLFFFGSVFMHGMNEGMIRLNHLKSDQLTLGIGMVACLIAAAISLFSGRKKSS